MLALKKKFLEEINHIQIQPVFRCVLSSKIWSYKTYFLISVPNRENPFPLQLVKLRKRTQKRCKFPTGADASKLITQFKSITPEKRRMFKMFGFPTKLNFPLLYLKQIPRAYSFYSVVSVNGDGVYYYAIDRCSLMACVSNS